MTDLFANNTPYSTCPKTRHRIGLILLASSLLTFLSAQHSVDTDRENANYLLGETITFQITSALSGSATYEIIQDKHTAATLSGTLELQAGEVLSLPFTPTSAAVVLCKVKKDGQTQIASAAISPFDLEVIEDEPPLFDAFWEEARNELSKIPIDPQLTVYRESDYATTYRVNIATIDNRRVYGYISVPKMEGPFPAVLTLPAYGSIANVVTPAMFLAEQAGALSIAISIHNTEPDQVDPNSYKPNDIMNEYTNYYRYAVLACIRAVDYLHTRADFNGELAVSGVSQGGGLSLMTAGLDERVDLLVYSNASHCEHAGRKYEEASGFPYYLNQARLMYNISEAEEERLIESCKYYDAIYFARRYNGPSLGFISYQDEVSPPTTTFKASNALKGMKILLHGKKLRHEHPEEYWVGRYDALRRFLPSSIRAPWPYARKTRGYFLDIGENKILAQGESIELSPSLMQHEEDVVLPAEWEMLEGPAEVVFSDANSLNTNVSFSIPGVYTLQVRVWDEALLDTKSRFYSISDEITVYVYEGNNLPLLAECPEGLTLFTSTDGAIANWSLPEIISSCDGANPSMIQTRGLGVGSKFPVGRTLVEYEITDACGSTMTCDFWVTVIKETLSPIEISCPENIVLYTDNESVIGNWALPEIISACNDTPATYTQIEGLPLGSSFPLGDTQISYEISDACGQMATCSFIVSVVREELEPLNMVCPENISINTDGSNAIVSWPLPVITSACENVESVLVEQTEGLEQGSLFPIGDTPISYTATDECGQMTTCSFVVQVVQNVAPLIITCPTNMELTTDIDVAIPSWELPTIVSACDESGVQYVQTSGPALGNPFPLGDTEIIYSVTDACGQLASCSFIISVVQNDQTALEVSCPENITLYTGTGSARPEWSLPEVQSSCGEDGVQLIQTQGLERGSVFPLGTTLVEYEVMDGCGQIAYCSFEIHILEENPPALSISCPYNIRLHITGQDTIVTWDLPEVLSACSDAPVTYTQVFGPARGALFSVGNSRVTYKVEDVCGQVQYCSFIVEVIQGIPTPLVVECPESITTTLLFQSNYTEIVWPMPQVLSYCSDELIISQIAGPPNGSFFWAGQKTITYLIQDGCGNRDSCTFEVLILEATEIEPDTDEMSTTEQDREVIAYPNPNTGKFTLTWQSQTEEHLDLEVINLLGQVCQSTRTSMQVGTNNLQVDISELAAGCYFWRLRSNSGWTVTRQLVKK